MSIQLSQTQQIYGIGSPIQNNFPFPQGMARALTTSDQGLIGQVVVALGNPYMMTAYGSGSTAGQYIWTQLETSGGGGVFSSLTVTPGPVSLTGTTTINTTGTAATTIGNTSGGAVSIVSGTAGTSLTTAATGAITLGAATMTGTITVGQSTAGQTINIGNAANAGAQVVNIASGASGANSTVNILNGTATAGAQTLDVLASSTSSGTINLGTGAAAHQITIGANSTNNETFLNSPITSVGHILRLAAGPVNIYSGAGVPSNTLALEVGDMYINTTAASATTRLYIATAASTWTNVTCAA